MDKPKFQAFLLIETSVNQTNKIVEELSKIDEVISVNSVTGPFDIIALIQTNDPNEMGDTIIKNIRTIQGIMRTLTCVVVG